MKIIKSATQLKVVILATLIITFLIGLTRIYLMTRLQDLGIYQFGFVDYFYRIATIFMVALIFLSANVFFNQIDLRYIKLNLMRPLGIITFNLIIFITLQFILVIPRVTRIKSNTDLTDLEFGSKGILFWAFMASVVLMLISVLIGTVYRFMRDNYLMQLRNEMLEKESAEARFANLKEQLNPHFLFNSFSTLNGLIDESPKIAKKFLHNMSDVYRYILKTESVKVVQLSEELEYTNLYIEIIKERFGEAVNVIKAIEQDGLVLKIPPLALQMLIENAVKHNNFDVMHPLRIQVAQSGSMLEVVNNLKARFVENTHSLGLYNLNQRYKYLSDKEIIIKKTSESFKVAIPLL